MLGIARGKREIVALDLLKWAATTPQGKASRSGRDWSKTSPDRVAMLRRMVKVNSTRHPFLLTYTSELQERSEWAGDTKEHLGLYGVTHRLEFGIWRGGGEAGVDAREENKRRSRGEYKRLCVNTLAHHHLRNATPHLKRAVPQTSRGERKRSNVRDTIESKQWSPTAQNVLVILPDVSGP
ncbi:hypothetical protein BJY52DRAFT_1222938 [Lactarius psammicola]|nr:hypothetical protein BJY52DRAFT_1222938 [Lactarius psammicola]